MAAEDFNHGIFRDLGDGIQYVPVLASATWQAGDFIELTDGSGYAQSSDAGDLAYGVAVSHMTAAMNPGASGTVTAPVYVGYNNQYIYPADEGTVTIALRQKKMDIGGARSVDIDASSDGCLLCVDIDIPSNSVIVQLLPAVWAGV